MPTYSLEGRIGRLIVRGGRLRADVAASITSASVALSSQEVTQLDLALVDNDFDIARSGLFTPGSRTTRGSRCDYGGLALEVRAVELAPRGEDNILRVTARSVGAGNARRMRGHRVRRKLSPTQYVQLGAKEAGLKFVGQPSAQRNAIARQKDESEWDTWQRLAVELGYYCFEVAGTVYFGKPTWLIDHTKTLRVAWKGRQTGAGIDALPVCRRSGDDAKRAATITAQLRGRLGEDALPGMRYVQHGIPLFDGAYMVDNVTLPLGENQPATVTAVTPINPKPQPPPKPSRASGGDTSSSPDSSSGATGARSAAAFVAVALAQAGDAYVYAAEASVSDPDPNAFDCSELVQWAAGRVGVPFTDGSASQIAACHAISVEQAIRTRGALLYHPGHIAISLGNGRTIEAANSRVGVVSYSAAGRFTQGGLIPGMRY